MEFLKNLGIATTQDAINTLKAQTFKVHESKSMIFCPMTNKLVENGYNTISNENGTIHGIVKGNNSVLQMNTLIDIAYNVSLNNDLNLDFNKSEINYFKNESICTLNIPLGVTSFTNNAGMQDETKIDLFIKTGFGGSTSTEIGIFSHRFVCSNGLEIRNGLNYFKAKHTENMNEKALVFLNSKIPTFMNSANDFKQVAEKYDKTLISKSDINDFRNSLFNIKQGEIISTKKANQMELFNSVLEVELSRCGQTAWGLLQSATNYTNNAHTKGSREFVVTGTGATMNQQAESLVSKLIY